MPERRYFAAIDATSLPWLIHSSVTAARLLASGSVMRARRSNSSSRAPSKFDDSNLRDAAPRDALKTLLMCLPADHVVPDGLCPEIPPRKPLSPANMPLARITFGPRISVELGDLGCFVFVAQIVEKLVTHD